MTGRMSPRPLSQALFYLALLTFFLPSQSRAQVCGDILTSSTTLSADLICPPGFTGVALTLSADGITLDGAGHQIVAPDAITIIQVKKANVTVQNINAPGDGTCTGTDVGLHAFGPDISGLKVYDSDFSNHTQGVVVSPESTIKVFDGIEIVGNDLTENCHAGFSVAAPAHILAETTAIKIESNDFTDCGTFAVSLRRVTSTTVRGTLQGDPTANTFTGAGTSASGAVIYVEGQSSINHDNLFIDLDLSAPIGQQLSGTGIHLIDGDNNRIENVIADRRKVGFAISALGGGGSTNAQLINSQALESSDFGVAASAPSIGNQIQDLLIQGGAYSSLHTNAAAIALTSVKGDSRIDGVQLLNSATGLSTLGSANFTMSNSFIANMSRYSIQLLTTPGARFLHNSFHGGTFYNVLINENSPNATFKYNVFSNPGAGPHYGRSAVNTGGLASDYNLFYRTTGNFDNSYTTLTAWQAGTGQDLNSLTGDPLFVDAANGDLHIANSSPGGGLATVAGICGDPGVLCSDIDGDARAPDPGGLAQPDIGADEVDETVSPPGVFSDDFESTPTGTLSSDYALVEGGAIVATGTQKDGSSGQFLNLEMPSLYAISSLEVVGAGNPADGQIRFNIKHNAETRVYFRAADLDNGYYLTIAGGFNSASLYKVEAGVSTALAHGALKQPVFDWHCITIEAVGDQFRIHDNEGLVMQAQDVTFAAGKVFIWAQSPNGFRTSSIDDLVIDESSTPQVPATPLALPFSTGFDDLALRNGVLQHPHIDLISQPGSVTYRQKVQKDGSTGSVMELLMLHPLDFATLELASADLGDFHFGFDHEAVFAISRVYFRAADVDNGYYVEFDNNVYSASLYKVVGGVSTRLARARTTTYPTLGQLLWRRFTIEAVGSDIRIHDGESMLVQATDATFAAGQIFIRGKASHAGSRTLVLDNLVLDPNVAPLIAANEAVLPLSSGFDDLAPRNGLIQHPNIDLFDPVGGVTYAQATQLDGTQGTVMVFELGHPLDFSGVAVATPALSDMRLSLDHKDFLTTTRFYFRAADRDNGYYLELGYNNNTTTLNKVQAGVSTALAHGHLTRLGVSDWRRFTIEAVGSDIRVHDGEGLLMRAVDATFSSGGVFIAGQAFGATRTMTIDNLEIDASVGPEVAATPISLPFATGLDDVAVRNGVLQQPNIDLVSPGSVTYLSDQQLDGSTGTVMKMVMLNPLDFSVVEIASGGLDDVGLDFDHKQDFIESRVYLRATDPDNGYYLSTNNVASSASIYKIAGGVQTLLASGPIPTGGQFVWRRLRFEAVGDELKVLEGNTLIAAATDNTFGNGKIFIAGQSLLSAQSLRIDNIDVEALAPPGVFSEDFESTPAGGLPSGWTAVSSTPTVNSGINGPNGSPTNVLNASVPTIVQLPTTPFDDYRLEVDMQVFNFSGGFIDFRGPDPDNGYRVLVSAGSNVLGLKLQKIVSGAAFATLANVHTDKGAGNWLHLIVQVEGDQIRVLETQTSADIVVNDNTFPGSLGDQVFLGSTAGAANFDNLSIEAAIPHLPATAVSLPFATGFETGERALRNEVLLPPNVDAFVQGGSYISATDINGAPSTVLNVVAASATAPAAMAVAGVPNDNVRIEADIKVSNFSGGFVHFRGPDLDNGYRVLVSAGSNVLGLKLQKIVSGAAFATLANVHTDKGAGNWLHLIIQVEGDQIRILETQTSADIVVTDNTFPGAPGDQVLLGSTKGLAVFDNLSIEAAIPHVPATAISLPFATGFEASERALRNGVLLPPNIDAFVQGGSYVSNNDINGAPSTMLYFVASNGPAAMTVVGVPNDDVRIATDLLVPNYSGGVIHFRGPDLNNGYRVRVQRGSGAPGITLQKVVGGAVANIAAAAQSTGSWLRLDIQVEGNQISVTDLLSGASIVANDNTFSGAPGDQVFLGSIAGSAIFDNLAIEEIIVDPFLVTNNGDSGPGSLRQAILNANATPGVVETITFAFPGAGPHTISPTSPLPEITDPIVIDGTSQPGYSGTPLIELEGSNITTLTSGLAISAGNTTVRGLIINRFTGSGIALFTNGGNTLRGLCIGTNAAGNAALPNAQYGIRIFNGSANNIIGGTNAADRNIISGNTLMGIHLNGAAVTGNLIQGNYIGTNLAGNAAVPNGIHGIEILASGNIVGGTDPGALNVISGNTQMGISIFGGSGNVVLGNCIGTNAAGTGALGNQVGVLINGSPNNTVGGTDSGSLNIISGNTNYGVQINGTASTGNVVLGNCIGTNLAGNGAVANGSDGIHIQNAPNNTVGGTDSGSLNIISGNAGSGVRINGSTSTGNVVIGNCIGTDINGTSALPNTGDGLLLSSSAANNTIGGLVAAARNIISGNSGDGVQIDGSGTTGNVVIGCYIGVDINGIDPLANGGHGVFINNSPNNTVGDTDAGGLNVISGNSGSGVRIYGTPSTGNRVLGSCIGTNAAGTGALANGDVGIVIEKAPANTIGGTLSGAGNLISGNISNGVSIYGVGSDGNIVQGNRIGVDINGSLALPNTGDGVGVIFDSFNNIIGGTGGTNTIAFNGDNGVELNGGTGHRVSENSIYDNGSLGINVQGSSLVEANDPGDVDTGTNNLQNFPVLTQAVAGATTISGTLNSVASTVFHLEFFANIACDGSDFGEGATFLGSTDVTTDTNGDVGFAAGISPALVDGEFITATATDPGGNTSEFCECLEVGFDPFLVTNGGDSGPGSLRQAILNANATPGVVETITFAFPGAGPHTISLLSALPYITDPCIIDGTSQPGYSGTPIIELEGSNITGGLVDGLVITAGNTTVRGLIINRFSANGIEVLTNGGNTFQGLCIGTNAAGTSALPNGIAGIRIRQGSSGNIIGGINPADRNIISGNTLVGVQLVGVGADDNIIQGNYIGTDITGTFPIPNQDGIELQGNNNTVGGTDLGALNVISGNSRWGIRIFGGSLNRILGNCIGTNAAGTGALANQVGISIQGAPDNTIGGTDPGARNIISGNTNYGVLIFGVDADGNVVLGNLIGTDINGTAALPNGNRGIVIQSAPNNTIGGTNPGALNVISGNTSSGVQIVGAGADGNVVLGNCIGTDINGTTALPNTGDGIIIYSSATNNTIGGLVSGALNIISGNNGHGVYISGSGTSDNFVQGCYIGVDITGATALGNGKAGVGILNAPDNIIGGTDPGARNIISANGASPVGGSGIGIGGITATGNLVQGCYIGVDITGTVDLGNNGEGIGIQGAPDNIIGGTDPGARNIISGNESDGIQIFSAGTTGNVVLGNYIGTDVTGTLPIGNHFNGATILFGPNTIGGTDPGAGNLISGNGSGGVQIRGASTTGVVVQGNLIGTDASGTSLLGTGGILISNAPNSLIGGPSPAAGNVITGGGITIVGTPSVGNAIQHNYIGTDRTGTIDLGNHQNGVNDGGSNTTIGGPGLGNTIAFNAVSGVLINGATNSAISENAIYQNGALGIDLRGSGGVTANDPGDLDTGANNLQNYPVLSGAGALDPRIEGALNSTPSTTYTLEFFANPVCDGSGFGEGATFLGAADVSTDANGDVEFEAAISGFAVGDFVTATATDPDGNTSEFCECVEAVDHLNKPPVANAGLDQLVECAAPTGTDVQLDGTGSSDPDDDDLTYAWSIGGQPLATGPTPTVELGFGTHLIDLVVNDGREDSPPDQVEIEIVDTTAPVITRLGAAELTIECTVNYVDAGATAADICDGDLTGQIAIVNPVDTSAPGDYTITYNVSDASGNAATQVTRLVHVVDTTPPVVALNGDNPQVLECPAPYVELGASASDTCDPTPQLVIDASAVDATTPGTYLVSYTATDASGNQTVVNRTVVVEDTTPPVVTLTGDNPQVLECPAAYIELGASARDTCDDNPTLVIDNSAVDATTPGDYLVTYTATDASGNQTIVNRTVSVVDTTPPVLTLLGDPALTVECSFPYADAGATALDLCDGDLTSQIQVVNPVDTAVPGTYTVTYNVSDASGNAATEITRTVTVVDTTPPVITLNGNDPIQVELGTPYTDPGATALDLCDGDLSGQIALTNPVDTNTEGTYTVTYDVSDAAGNPATATRTVEVLATPNSYVLIAAHSMHIKEHAIVHSGFAGVVDFGSPPFQADGVELVVGSQALTEDGVRVSGPRVRVKNKATIAGTLVYDELDEGPNVTIGEHVTPGGWPLFDGFGLPAFQSGAPGLVDIEVKKNKSLTLAPEDGPFNLIEVENNGTLFLSGGIYHISEMDLGTKVAVLVQAPTTLLIADKFALGQQSYFGPETTLVDPNEIFVFVEGTNGSANLNASPRAAELGVKTIFAGNIYVPNGTLHLEQQSQSTGSFIGRDVILGTTAEVHLRSGWNTPGVIFDPPIPATKLAFIPPDGSGSLVVDNYPNPFNPATTIRYLLPAFGRVQLTVYNALGQEVKVLVNQPQPMGVYLVEWDGREQSGHRASSGIYFYRLQSSERMQTGRMLLLK